MYFWVKYIKMPDLVTKHTLTQTSIMSITPAAALAPEAAVALRMSKVIRACTGGGSEGS